MIRFAYIEVLWALMGLPIIFLITYFFVRWKKRTILKLTRPENRQILIPRLNPTRWWIKIAIIHVLFALFVLVLARPQLGSKVEQVKTTGIDMVVCLDISNSMMAEDLKPNRLERAKQSIQALLEKLKGDRIGLVLFAGTAYVQLPITDDYAAAKMFVSTVNTNLINSQGTNITEALAIARESFPKERKGDAAIIVITDGENHEGDVIAETELCIQNGIRVFTIGLGDESGVPIPVYENGVATGFKTDKDGNTVVTKLNASVLKEMAQIGNGIYVKGNNPTAALDEIYNAIDKLEKSELEATSFAGYEDQFQWIVGFILVLLIVELTISERKSFMLSKWDLLNEKK